MAIGKGDEGIFAVLEGIIVGIGEKIGAAAAAVGDAMGGAGGGTGIGASIGGAFSSFGDWVSGGLSESRSIQAPVQEIAPQLTIQGPVQDHHYVDMEEYGRFPPPAVGAIAARSTGVDMASFT